MPVPIERWILDLLLDKAVLVIKFVTSVASEINQTFFGLILAGFSLVVEYISAGPLITAITTVNKLYFLLFPS